jgi:hypothetical protein
MSDAEVTALSRSLQDEILESRRRGPAVFDFVYKRLHCNYETQMNQGAVELVLDAKRKLGAC